MNQNVALKKSFNFLLALCLTLCTGWIFTPLKAAPLTWSGTEGDWDEGANWSGGSVPTDADDVGIQGSDKLVEVTTNDAEAKTIQISAQSGSVDNELKIENGGILNITGTGTSLSIGRTGGVVGGDGSGLLRINAGGQVISVSRPMLGDYATGSGTMIINGSGASFTANSGEAVIGNNGYGKVEITNGGLFELKGTNSLVIGKAVGGAGGDVVVTGANSKLLLTEGTNRHIIISNNASLEVGAGGLVQHNGQLTVANIGTTAELRILAGGKVISTGSNGGVVGDANKDNKGTAYLAGEWEATALNVGYAGLGEMTIVAGGKMTTTGNSYIGRDNNAEARAGVGYLTVEGEDAKWLGTGNLTVGQRGEGTIKIFNGGLVQSGTVSLGDLAQRLNPESETIYSKGTVIIENGTWTTTGNINVGNAGEGSITVGGATGVVNVNGGNGTISLANTGNLTTFSPTQTNTTIASQSGELNIGAAVGESAIAAGRVNAATVTSSTNALVLVGASKLNFNHTDSNYSFQRTNGDNINITNKVQVNAYSGVTKLEKADGYTYSGGTSIYGGTLLVNNTSNSGTGTGEVIVHSGGTFGGSGLITGALTLEDGGNLSPGATQNSVGNLRAANFTWDGGGKMVFSLGSTEDLVDSDRLTLSGSFVKSGTGSWIFAFSDASLSEGPQIGNTYTLVTFNSYSGFSESDFGFTYTGSLGGMEGSFALHSGDLQFTVTGIPEPGVLSLLVAGGIGALLYTRRRRKQSEF